MTTDPQHTEHIEPEYADAPNPSREKLNAPEQAEDDPVTRRTEDPAAMSEAERNRRLTDEYNA